MSAVINDKTSATGFPITEKTPVPRTKRVLKSEAFSVIKWYNDRKDKLKLKHDWFNRNIEHGEIFLDTLQVEFIQFQQCIFVHDTTELASRLTKIGFTPLRGFPDEGLYEDFSHIMYSSKHNLAISLYPREYEPKIRQAVEIAKPFESDFQISKDVFATAMKVLSKR